ncbi:MAG: CPBP family glutamic-type intramembrane protease [Coriobacteriia bacterium]|nr:CPBP family glutamic-type intramembrane protease [Coriobacteriia bacterium]
MTSFIDSLYKSVLRRQVMYVVLALLGFYVLNFIGSYATISIYRAIVVASGARVSYMLPPEIIGLSSIIGIIAGAVVMLALRGKRLVTTDLTHVNEPARATDIMAAIMLMIGIQAVMYILTIILFIMTSAFIEPVDSAYEQGISSLLTPIGILYIVLIGPVFEEIIFRGAIMRSLERFGVNYAIVISSIIFGIYHIYFQQIFFAFSIGLIFAFVAQRFSLKWAIYLHIFNNLFSVCQSILVENNPDLAVVVILLLYFFALLGSIIYLAISNRRIKSHLGVRKPASKYFVLGQVPGVAVGMAPGVAQGMAPAQGVAPGAPLGMAPAPGIAPTPGMAPAPQLAPTQYMPGQYAIPQQQAAFTQAQQPYQQIPEGTPIQPVSAPDQYSQPQPPAYAQSPYLQGQQVPYAQSPYPQVQPVPFAQAPYSQAQPVPHTQQQVPMGQLQIKPTKAQITAAFEENRQTGVFLPPAMPGEPAARPFRITFSSPIFIALLVLFLGLGLIIQIAPYLS